MSAVDSMGYNLYQAIYFADGSYRYVLDAINSDTSGFGSPHSSALASARFYTNNARMYLYSMTNDYLTVSNAVADIECTSCTNLYPGGGGSCCSGVDLEPIITRLNIGITQRDAITNDVSTIIQYLRDISSQLTAQDDTLSEAYPYQEMVYQRALGRFNTRVTSSWWTDEDYDSIANNVLSISYSMAEGIPSINNYLYNFWRYQNAVITNKITSIDKNLQSFFTFFKLT